MPTRDNLRTTLRQQPFRPIRIHMASGRAYEIRHPETIAILASIALIFSPEMTDSWETVSQMLMESVSFLDTPAESAR